VHLTDVRDGLIRGVRTVALMLLSWLLLVLTVLVAGFLLALPFTGLEGLWRTGSATALVLSTAGTVVILINAAYQDGRPDNLPPVVLRVAVRVASVLLTPLILIAAWGLSLRIGQHGLTPDRIIAVACAVVGAVYAIGYGRAALVTLARKGSGWMKALEPTNIAAAGLSVLIILALFSPIADPARVSVGDQMNRLKDGRVAPDRFDYAFLRFDGGKTGEAALAELAASPDDRIASAARRARATKERYALADKPPEAVGDLNIIVVPAGSVLPPSFADTLPPTEAWRSCLPKGKDGCVARLDDLDDDGRPEILVAHRFAINLFTQGDDGRWSLQGAYTPRNCPGADPAPDARDLLRHGPLQPATPRWPTAVSGGNWSFITKEDCPGRPDVEVETIPLGKSAR